MPWWYKCYWVVYDQATRIIGTIYWSTVTVYLVAIESEMKKAEYISVSKFNSSNCIVAKKVTNMDFRQKSNWLLSVASVKWSEEMWIERGLEIDRLWLLPKIVLFMRKALSRKSLKNDTQRPTKNQQKITKLHVPAVGTEKIPKSDTQTLISLD